MEGTIDEWVTGWMGHWIDGLVNRKITKLHSNFHFISLSLVLFLKLMFFTQTNERNTQSLFFLSLGIWETFFLKMCEFMFSTISVQLMKNICYPTKFSFVQLTILSQI